MGINDVIQQQAGAAGQQAPQKQHGVMTVDPEPTGSRGALRDVQTARQPTPQEMPRPYPGTMDLILLGIVIADILLLRIWFEVA